MPESKQKLTREFCKNKKLIFFPKSEKEAEFIQKQLFSLGFSREAGKIVQELENCVSKGMCLSEKGIIYYGPDPKEKGDIECSSQDFIDGFDPHALKYLSGDELVLEAFNRISSRIEKIEKGIKTLENEIKEIKNPTYRKLEKPKVQKKQGL